MKTIFNLIKRKKQRHVIHLIKSGDLRVYDIACAVYGFRCIGEGGDMFIQYGGTSYNIPKKLGDVMAVYSQLKKD